MKYLVYQLLFHFTQKPHFLASQQKIIYINTNDGKYLLRSCQLLGIALGTHLNQLTSSCLQQD